MNKKILIGSMLAVALLTLVSFSNVVGYNTIKTSQEELIENEYDFNYCKDYLFQTLVDISNNPDVRDIINSNHKPQRTMLPFRRSNVDLKVEHLELLYEMGLKIMDRLGEEKVEELMENIEMEKPEYLDELDAIVMGNDELRERIYTLNEMNGEPEWFWPFPIICSILIVLVGVIVIIEAGFVSFVIYKPIHILLSEILKAEKLDSLWLSIVSIIFAPIIYATIFPFVILYNYIFQCELPDFP